MPSKGINVCRYGLHCIAHCASLRFKLFTLGFERRETHRRAILIPQTYGKAMECLQSKEYYQSLKALAQLEQRLPKVRDVLRRSRNGPIRSTARGKMWAALSCTFCIGRLNVNAAHILPRAVLQYIFVWQRKHSNCVTVTPDRAMRRQDLHNPPQRAASLHHAVFIYWMSYQPLFPFFSPRASRVQRMRYAVGTLSGICYLVRLAANHTLLRLQLEGLELAKLLAENVPAVRAQIKVRLIMWCTSWVRKGKATSV
jgi:hypothetical protein